MNYGKLFKKLMAAHPEFANLSANKCSALTYKELRAISKVLYPDCKDTLTKYFLMTKEALAKAVYTALKKLYN